MEKARLLIIDDEEFNLDALNRLFRKDYEIDTALSGKEAIQKMKETPYDIILSDQRMPGKTGVETLKESLKLQPNSSRILLTGYTDLESVISSINEAKIHMYLTKPWDNKQLSLSLEQAADAAKMRKDIKQKNIDLAKANEELKQLDQAKNHFMSMINHELKTPLTTISSYLQILKEESDSSVMDYICGIEKGYDRLSKLTDLSLIIIQANNQQLKVNKKSLSVKDCVQKALDKLQTEIEKNKIKIKLEIQDKKWKVDPKLIDILCFELIENAVRYSKKGEEVSINYQNSLLSISNSGSMTKEKQENIFKAFYVDSSIMNHSNSTGLGVSVCQAILEAHNSKLQLNCENKKITFSFQV